MTVLFLHLDGEAQLLGHGEDTRLGTLYPSRDELFLLILSMVILAGHKEAQLAQEFWKMQMIKARLPLAAQLSEAGRALVKALVTRGIPRLHCP